MPARVLTDRQRRVLRAMSHTYEPASDIAHRAEVDNRGAGAVLWALAQRGLVERRRIENTDYSHWRLTDDGAEAIR